MRLACYVAILLSTCLAFYVALLGFSYVEFPVHGNSGIDTHLADKSLFSTEPKYLIFSLDRLRRPGPHILFLGASNVREGFRPQEVQAYVGRVPVDNLAVGASEIRETAEEVGLIYREVPPSSWRDQTFVLGMWYGMFQPDARAWPEGVTDIDREQLRYDLADRDGNAITRHHSLGVEIALEQAVRPMLLISRVYDLYVTPAVAAARVTLLRLVGETPADVTVIDRDNFQLSAAERAASLAAWRNRMGPSGDWDEQQFQRFDSLVRNISRHGSRLILLDLPLPTWHRDALPYDAEYQKHIASHLKAALMLPRVSYFSMRDGFDDQQFYDSAHPRPRATRIWARKAATALKRAMRGA